MLHLPEIWECIQNYMPRSVWVDIQDVYKLIQNHLHLDDEDSQPQSPTSPIPKWQRNVRNVLQYRKRTNEIEWDGNCKYRLSQ